MSNDNFCICSWGIETIGLHERGHWDQGFLRCEPNLLMLQTGLHNLNLCLRDVCVGLNVPAKTREIQENYVFVFI